MLPITYLRSSLLGSWEICPHSAALQYTFGFKQKPRDSTERGSMVHKALELLAQQKKASQDERSSFFDAEINRSYNTGSLSAVDAIQEAFDFYSEVKNESGHKWSAADHKEVARLTNEVLNYDSGSYDPRNLKVVDPEKYFDITLDEPWATYKYVNPFDGKEIYGKLAIRGSIDLTAEMSRTTLHFIDYKTGQRKNWATGQKKEQADLEDDKQLLLYYLALTKLYPQYTDIVVTIFFIKDGGPFIIPYQKRVHVPAALEMLRSYFDKVRSSPPDRIIGDTKRASWCYNLCQFYKNRLPDGRRVCSGVHEDILQLGLDRAIKKHGVKNAFLNYGSGGGQSDRESKPIN